MTSKIKEDLSNKPKLLALLNMMRKGNSSRPYECSVLALPLCEFVGTRYIMHKTYGNNYPNYYPK